MRRYIISLAAVALFGSGFALAQSDMWVGASTGYPFGLTVHVGFEDLIGQDIDLRANVTGTFSSSLGVTAFGAQLGADVLFGFAPIEGAIALNPYAGGGPLVIIGGATGGGVSAGVFGFGVTGVAGVEYLFTPEIGAFLEMRVGAGYIGAGGIGIFAPLYGASLGVNYHF